MADPVARQRIADLGMDFPPAEIQTPAAFAAFHKSEIEKWWPIVKAAGIKAEGVDRWAGRLPQVMLWTAPPPAHECHGCGGC